MGSEDKHYYYVEGERQELDLDPDSVAIDLEPLAGAALERARELVVGQQNLRREVYLAPRERLSEEDERQLTGAGALHPVFRHGDSLVVALPEVRVEATGRAQQRSLRKLLDAPDVDAELVRDRGERLTIRPKSGLGIEALKLANRLQEELEPELAQVRFLRMVPRPGTRSKS